tara:strand:- start:1321 stop:1650 length:330 start_codon:yes stop_codon:yes gene_type:complete
MKILLTKVTIISEGLLKEGIVKMIKSLGATGYTLTKVEGEGSRGVRASDWEGRNIRIETIVTSECGDTILERLNAEYFEDYSVIAWLSEVNVLRGEKFVGKSPESGDAS